MLLCVEMYTVSRKATRERCNVSAQGKEPEDVPFPWGDVPKAVKAGMYNSVLDVTVLSTRGVLDAVAQGRLPRWLSHKMCKGIENYLCILWGLH